MRAGEQNREHRARGLVLKSGLFERADSRPEKADFRPERVELTPERADFKPERADFKPEGVPVFYFEAVAKNG